MTDTIIKQEPSFSNLEAVKSSFKVAATNKNSEK